MTIITAGVTGDVVPRIDLRNFVKDADVLNLFILATQRMQGVDQKDLNSWFQICGIHGRPYIPYDNVGELGKFGGYCTHSSILFPTWHRPYLALYEQALAKHVNDIANEFTDPTAKKKYTDAAKRFRVPYWDWAADPYLPDIVSQQENVKVTTPKGDQTVKNPLYSYTFHPVYSDFGDGLPSEKTWESWQSTLRWPSATDASGHSQPVSMERQLQNNRLTLRDRTYNLLTQATTYEAFSNDGFLGPQSDPRFYDSLESIHGQIHGLVGKNGHMGVVDFAAFDPVFWLHHCNVDRIFALWQALNPDRFVVPRVNESGTFATAAGTIENADSPLPPFWQAPGKLWTSNGARDTRTFKYTYPELEMWADKPQDVRRANLRTQINKLYGATAPVASVRPNIFAAKPAAPAAPPAGGAKAQQPLAHPEQKPAAPAAPHKPVGKDEVEFTADTHKEKPHSKTSYYEWIANIRVEKYAVKTTFFIHIFLGDFTDDYKKWGEDPNLIGSHVVFGTNLDHTGCERCLQANHKQKLVTGTIPLTGALGDKLGTEKLTNLDPEFVVPYLKDNLHWRVQKHDDTPVERSEIPTLKISVGHSLVEPPTSVAEFPKWGEMTLQHGVTAGRAGGASEEDD